ncbi:MAG TPA: ElyC/SanA/YdcF family protein [Polyangiaceae bacterium]|nr:ElyC/SanA/YdcF family protein [Polyangiaceae bacterium]
MLTPKGLHSSSDSGLGESNPEPSGQITSEVETSNAQSVAVESASTTHDVIVVLGCRVPASGPLGGAAARRARRAAQAYREGLAPWILASGGKIWGGRSEAHAFRSQLVEAGVPEQQVICELESLSTRGNAREVARLCAERAFRRIAVVTCEWHMPRALRAFARHGVDAHPLPAPAPDSPRHRYLELVQSWLDAALFRLERGRAPRIVTWMGFALGIASGITAVLACQETRGMRSRDHDTNPSAVASASASAKAHLEHAAFAEGAALEANDLQIRREAARRGMSNPTDAQFTALLRALADADPIVLSRVALALGKHCAGREDVVVRALVVRAASFIVQRGASLSAREADAAEALARALGGCESREAERSLVALLELPAYAEGAALGLGDLGASRGSLDEASYLRLLAAATRSDNPVPTALYLFSRVTPTDPEIAARGLQVARQCLARGPECRGSMRQFALRALAHAGDVATLSDMIHQAQTPALERAELIRDLGRQGQRGLPALWAAFRELVPRDLQTPLTRPLAEVLDVPTLLAALESLPSPSAPEPALDLLVRLTASAAEANQPATQVRLTSLRCGAARVLANADWAHSALAACPADTRIGKLTRLRVIDRGRFSGARRDAYLALLEDADATVRQAALRLVASHREFTDLDAPIQAALGSNSLGLIAAAAEFVSQHPSRLGASPVGLTDALRAAWSTTENAHNPGVQALLIDAIAALSVLPLLSQVEHACAQTNPTLRRHAERALSTLGQGPHRCHAPPSTTAPNPSLPASADAHVELTRTADSASGQRDLSPIELEFETDAGPLELRLDPEIAPAAVAHIASLVRNGFYDGIEIHRYIPGFAVQFGDPTGDGYGGDPAEALSTEVSPGRFRALSVGLAESGEGTGKSQLFVLLTDAPHLDGTTTRLGKASSGWELVVPGDRIRRARLRVSPP